jgi:hypothetical protein
LDAGSGVWAAVDKKRHLPIVSICGPVTLISIKVTADGDLIYGDDEAVQGGVKRCEVAYGLIEQTVAIFR